MEYFPAALEKLVEQFARLPGIGGKSAQRLAFHVLSLTDAEAQEFADAIVEAKKKVTCCPICRNLTDGGLCPICASPKRDERVICVVADARDVAALERSREYTGRYHVLHGVISPMNHSVPTIWRSSLSSSASPPAASTRSSWRPIPTRRARPRRCISRGCCAPLA